MTARLVKKKNFLMIISFCLLSSSCGYRLARPVNPMLENVSTIAIPYFKNKTFEPEAEAIFTYAFINEFIESRRLQVVGVEDADVVLYGTVKRLLEDTIAYNRDDKAQEYRVRVTLAVFLEERKSGNVLWKRKSLRHAEEFPVDNNIVLSETAKRDALQRIAEDLAERVHDSIMQGF
jgi:hypothetical protein